MLLDGSVKPSTPLGFCCLGAEQCRIFKSKRTAFKSQVPLLISHLSVEQAHR